MRISEDAKEELIKRFRDFPVDVVACAWVYAVALNKFGVDVSKGWETVTQKRSELDLAYRRGRSDEAERWKKNQEPILHESKKCTNYECLAGKTIGEFAEWAAELSCAPNSKREDCLAHNVNGQCDCVSCWVDWLKREEDHA